MIEKIDLVFITILIIDLIVTFFARFKYKQIDNIRFVLYYVVTCTILLSLLILKGVI